MSYLSRRKDLLSTNRKPNVQDDNNLSIHELFQDRCTIIYYGTQLIYETSLFLIQNKT